MPGAIQRVLMAATLDRAVSALNNGRQSPATLPVPAGAKRTKFPRFHIDLCFNRQQRETMTKIIAIDHERLAKVQAAGLGKGKHPPPPDDGEFCGCIMEAYAWITHRPWTDHDDTACPIIGAFLRSWNDALPDERRGILLPLLPMLPNTRASVAVERRRVIMINDWLIRVDTPAWLRLAGLNDQASALETLPEITDFETTPAIRGALEAAARDAEVLKAKEWAARAARAAWAAWAARDARAARDAWAAWASRAAWAAWAARAAWDAELKATVDHLEASAVALIERLCALKDE